MLPSTLISRCLRCVASSSCGGGLRGPMAVRTRPLQTTTLSDSEDGGGRKDAEEEGTKATKRTTRLKLRSSGKRASYPRVYTRTGDGGNSSLFTGERRPKDDLVFQALGATDELSSHIGLAMEFGRAAEGGSHPYVDQLERVQCMLQDIGTALATPHSSARQVHEDRTSFNSRHTKELEEWIDQFSEELPPLENFILPGGVCKFNDLLA